MTSMPSVNDVEIKDSTEGQHLCDVSVTDRKKALKESIRQKCYCTSSHLPLYKMGTSSNVPISISLTVHLNIEALLTVLCSEKKSKVC